MHKSSFLQSVFRTVVAPITIGIIGASFSSRPIHADQYNKIMVIDASNPTQAPTPLDIDGISGPSGIDFYGTQAFVCNGVGNSISVINTANNTLIKTITHPLLRFPYNIKIAQHLHKAYICNLQGDLCVISNLQGTYTFHTIKNLSAKNIVIDSTTNTAYTCGRKHPTYQINLINDSVVASRQLSPDLDRADVIILSSDNSQLYVGGSTNRNWDLDPCVVVLSKDLSSIRSVNFFAQTTGGLSFGVRGMVASNGFLYIACKGLFAMNEKSEKCTTLGIGSSLCSYYAIAIHGSYLYATDFGFFPARHAFPPSVQCPGGSSTSMMGNGSGTSVHIYDLTSHLQTQSVIVEGFNSPQALGVFGNHIYVCDGSPLRIVCDDVALPSQIQSSTFSRKHGLYSP